MATANSGEARYIIYMGALSPSLHRLQSGNIPVIGDKLTAGPPRWAIMSAAILDNCSTVAEAAGVASVSMEYQPSLLAHIQPSVLISRYVLTIALMCLLSRGALVSPKHALFVPCTSSHPSLASPLPREHCCWNQPLSVPWNSWVIEGAQVSRFSLCICREMCRMCINSCLNQLLCIKH